MTGMSCVLKFFTIVVTRDDFGKSNVKRYRNENLLFLGNIQILNKYEQRFMLHCAGLEMQTTRTDQSWRSQVQTREKHISSLHFNS